MWTTVAFQERRVAPGLQELKAVPDETHFTSDDDLRVAKYNKIMGLACLGYAPQDAYVISPSLRAISRVYIAPMTYCFDGAMGTRNYQFDDRSRNLIPLVSGESLNAFYQKTADDVTQDDMIVVWLTDGAVTPVFGDIRTIKASCDGVYPPLVWTNDELSWTPDLPAGIYAIVGARAYLFNSPGVVRFNFRDAPNRPGVLTLDETTQLTTDKEFRKGYLGEFGRFDINSPPSVDILPELVAGATELYMRIDIIKVA